MKKWYIHILLLSAITIIYNNQLIAQNSNKSKTRISLEYVKQDAKSERLVATLKIKEDRYVALKNETVLFYSIHDTARVLLDKINTNEEGKAIFEIEDDPKIFKDSLNFLNFEVEYLGNSSSNDCNNDIAIKQAKLDISFFQKDTIKYIAVDFNELSSKKATLPISDFEILFYIKGTFSLLNIGEKSTDEDGKAIIEFPVYMPGDTAGVLTIVSKVEESDIYGTIISSGKMNWGKMVPLAKEKHRGLGDTDAPLWMVYTLIILLSAVWFHYFYVIYLVIKIKLANKPNHLTASL